MNQNLNQNTMKSSTILVADDEPSVALELQYSLLSNSMDYRFVKAYTGDDAFNKAKKEKPNLIVLDIMMPQSEKTLGHIDPQQGIKVFKKLKKDPETKDIPIIFSSINAKANFINRDELDAEGFFAKFYDDDEKLEFINKILNNSN